MINWFLVVIGILVLILLFFRERYLGLLHKYEQLLRVKRSENVKHGQSFEQFVPFASNFPFSKSDFKFLGQPIDGIVFGTDKITFIEIKTGTSGLNTKQKEVRDLVEAGKVEWKELRY